MGYSLNNHTGKIIEGISFNEGDSSFDKRDIFQIKLDEEIFTINASSCRCFCMRVEIEKYKNYDLNDLKEKIFIEFGECRPPEDVTFQNEDFDDDDESENIAYHYYYIEYKYPDSEEHFYYCFCLTCKYDEDFPGHCFQGLDIKEEKKKKDKEIELKSQKDLFNTKSTDNV